MASPEAWAFWAVMVGAVSGGRKELSRQKHPWPIYHPEGEDLFIICLLVRCLRENCGRYLEDKTPALAPAVTWGTADPPFSWPDIPSPKKPPRIRQVAWSAMQRVAPSFRGRLTLAKLARLMYKSSRLICFSYSENSGIAGAVHGWFEVGESRTLSIRRQWDPKLVELSGLMVPGLAPRGRETKHPATAFADVASFPLGLFPSASFPLPFWMACCAPSYIY